METLEDTWPPVNPVNVSVTQEVLGLNEVFLWPHLVNKVPRRTLVSDTFCALLHNPLVSTLLATARTTDQDLLTHFHSKTFLTKKAIYLFTFWHKLLYSHNYSRMFSYHPSCTVRTSSYTKFKSKPHLLIITTFLDVTEISNCYNSF